MANTVNIYYKRIIDLILSQYKDEFANAQPGHCMKITGLGLNELEILWDDIHVAHPHIDSFIVSEENVLEDKFISATKLIEYRNKQVSPLLVLIPSNSRTAAEDSYGNATFKEISLEGIENSLRQKLLSSVPDNLMQLIKVDILNYLNSVEINTIDIIKYLLVLEQSNYSVESIGDSLYLLNLIPDSKLVLDPKNLRSRLNYNLESIALLSSFSKPLYDRIGELPLEPQTLQKELVAFIKAENSAKSANELCALIADKYPNLNFCNWEVPELNFEHIKLVAEDIKSKDFIIEEGRKILRAEENKTVKVRVRFSTNLPPKDIADLKFFRIKLYAVDGADGEEIKTLRILKNSASNRPYREATVELDSNNIEEGSYFFKVLAEDALGNCLNYDDDFKEEAIQNAWEGAKEKDSEAHKDIFPYKLSCDSEDFDYAIEEDFGAEEKTRKSKLNNVLQAFFKYRIDGLKSSEEQDIPSPAEFSNVWLSDRVKHTSTFHINYSDKHNYQINISTKLRIIEDKFLQNADSFGHVKGVLKSDSNSIGFERIDFVSTEITSIVPNAILKLRSSIFNQIINSNPSGDGILETADVFKFYKEIKQYISKLSGWTLKLKQQIESKELSVEERSKLQLFLSELQILDVAKIKTRLPNGQSTEAMLVSPLHPLRLIWLVELIEVFTKWEEQTLEYDGYKEAWTKNLDQLFEGQLSPENNPPVLFEPNSLKSYLYSGEIAYGWGLYLNVVQKKSTEGMTSVSRQLKLYFRELLNINQESFVDNDVSHKLVIRHLRNYLSQHPYTDKLIINLFNSGDASVFAESFVELEKYPTFKKVKYEVRIFKGDDKIIAHGGALKELLNPEFNVTEEAEAFSQPSQNRLFPKLRFSINSISDYLKSPAKHSAHLSFLISPFPITVELIKPYKRDRNFYLNGLLTESTILVEESGNEIKWNRFIQANELPIGYDGGGKLGTELFDNIQTFIGGALASKPTESIPSTQLRLNDKDKVLLSHLHDYSDWVITFDKNIGPQIFDQPSKDGKIPFLLDYVPGEEASGVSSFLTTRPTSEILGLLGPHFEEFGLSIHTPEDKKKITILLEDLRAVSSSLVLQLNSSKNKAFEVIGSAFTKRVLEKKGFLEEAFLIPIDLHQNLFENLPSASKSRADNLLVSIDPDNSEISISVIEIKCRKMLGVNEGDELKQKMMSQIENTIEALRSHFDPTYHHSHDRLDREIKNKELKALLSFYIERAYRYKSLSENAYHSYLSFLQYLDNGFDLRFKQIGIIFDFSASQRHHKELLDQAMTCFTFGEKLIDEILDEDSDLNTRRLEHVEIDDEISAAIGVDRVLKPFIQKFKEKEPVEKVSDASYDVAEEQLPATVGESPQVQEVIIEDSSIQDNTDKESAGEIIPVEPAEDIVAPSYDILIGKSSPSSQYGILGESIRGKKIALDLSETNTVSLFGVQGGGKSYTIGTISEMVLKEFHNINQLPSPLAGVIFHYSESMDYEPEFTSMTQPNDKESELQKLKERYGASPDSLEDVVLLTPQDKIEERKEEYPSIEVLPIAFNSKELMVQDWMFLLGAVGNDSAYVKQLKAIMKQNRRNLTLQGISESVEDTVLLSNAQKALARQKLSFAREYIDDDFNLKHVLKPGRLVIVDLRDEFIDKDEALGLFVIMLNIFSSVKVIDNQHFNKFIVFDEAHKYMDNKDLTGNIVTAIREMRHKGVSIMIASQDPPSLPNEVIELSSVVLLHKFNSPQWLKHIQKSVTQLSTLSPADMSSLNPGEGFLWATKATEKSISTKPVKVSTRPRVTKHGGGTIQATGN